MSWFRRRPKVKEPERKTPHLSSPMTEKKLEEAKKLGVKVKQKPLTNN